MTSPQPPQFTTSAARVRATRRVLTATGAISALTLGAQVLWWNDLPDPVASHFTFSGSPDGFMSRGSNLAVSILVVIGLPLLMVALIRMDRRFTIASRFLGAFGVGMSAFIAALFLAVLNAQRGVADPATVSFPGIRVLLPALVGTAVGLIMYRLLPTPDPLASGRESAPALELTPTEQVRWSATQSNPWFLVLSLGFILCGAIIVPLTDPVIGWILVITGALLAVTFSQVTVTIDASGITWRLGIGLFRGHLGLDELTQARAVEVIPTRYGGWGYRFSSQGRAIVMVEGPGITLEREGKQDFTITVPDAETGAAVANGLIARARA